MAKTPTSPKLTTNKFIARKEREERQAKIALNITGIILAIILLIVAYVLVDNYIIKPRTVVATVGETQIRAGEFDRNVRYARDNMLKQASQYYSNYMQFQSFSPEYAQQFLAIAQRNAVELNQGDVVGNRVLNDMVDDVLIAEEAEKMGITVSDKELNAYIEERFGFFADGTPYPANTATPFNTPTVSSQQETLIAPPATEEAEPPAGEAEATPVEPSEEETAEPAETVATEPVEEAETPEAETPEAEAEETPETEPTEEGTATPVPTITPSPTPYTRRLFDKEFKQYADAMSKNGVSKSDVRRILRGAVLRTKMMEAITADLPAEEEQVWARHILVESKDVADQIVERLNNGEDFGELAKELSTDPGSKDNGGDLGWFGKGRMVPEFEQASYALENIGDISEPINTNHGWHIIQLIGKGTNSVGEQDHERLKAAFFENWLQELRNKRTDIQLSENWLKSMPTKPEIPAQFYNAIMNPTGN